MSGDSSSDYQIDDGEKSDEEDGDSGNSNHDSSDGSTMGGDSSSDYQMSAGESSDDEDCALLSCRNDICAIRDVDEKDKLIYKMESIDVDGQRGQLHRAYRSSGDWVSIEDWAMWIAEKSRRGNQARSATVKAIKVSGKKMGDRWGFYSLNNEAIHLLWIVLVKSRHPLMPFSLKRRERPKRKQGNSTFHLR